MPVCLQARVLKHGPRNAIHIHYEIRENNITIYLPQVICFLKKPILAELMDKVSDRNQTDFKMSSVVLSEADKLNADIE